MELSMEMIIASDVQLDRHSELPLYQQLSNVIVEQIDKGNLKSGDQLPSENELIIELLLSASSFMFLTPVVYSVCL